MLQQRWEGSSAKRGQRIELWEGSGELQGCGGTIHCLYLSPLSFRLGKLFVSVGCCRGAMLFQIGLWTCGSRREGGIATVYTQE